MYNQSYKTQLTKEYAVIAYFNRFEISMTKGQAASASHSGDCRAEVLTLLEIPKIAKQLDKIGPVAIMEELREYGAWNDEELADNQANRLRIVWIAAGNISDS